jgi:UMF1 family MFS transporter
MTSEKRRIWGWYFFDWASQPFSTLLLTFVFGPFFAVAARNHYLAAGMDETAAGAAAQSLWGWGLTLSGLLIAVLAPVLGAVADQSGRRMIWIWVFSVLYIGSTWMLWSLLPDGTGLYTALIWFGLGLIAMEFATIFTNGLMPDLTGPETMGRMSGNGFALGYLGGIVSLVLVLLFLAESPATGRTLIGLAPGLGFLDPTTQEGTRAVGPFTAVWYAVFMIPFFVWVRPAPQPKGQIDLRGALRSLMTLLRGLPSRPSLFAFLGGSMFYRDALNGLYGVGGVYAAGVLGWSVTQMGVFGIVSALAAMVATYFGGRWDSRFGPKPVIMGALVVLALVCVLLAGTSRSHLFGMPLAEGSVLPDMLFYLIGILIGGAGGITQAASRTLMVFHASPGRETEAFGLYALSGKATAFIAPASITLATMLSGSQQIGITPLIALFVLGAILLVWVKPQGDRAV